MTAIVSNVPSYNANGCRLLSKKTSQNKTTTLVETGFGRGSTEIEQYYDDDKKLTRLSIVKKEYGKTVSKLVKHYIKLSGTTEIYTDVFDGKGKQIESDSEMQKVIEDEDGQKSLVRINLNRNYNEPDTVERQAYEHLHNAKNKALNKTLYTEAIRSSNGRLTDKKVSGNVDNIDTLAKDPYLYIRNYPIEEFVEAASYIGAQKQGVPRGKFVDTKLKDTRYGVYNIWPGKVTIDSQKSYKSELTNTINHEYRHKFQHQLRKQYFARALNFLKKPEDKISMTQQEKKQAREFLKGQLTYCQPEKNYEKYYSSILEVDARKAGEEAAKEFDDASYRLAQAFDASDAGKFWRMFTLSPEIVVKQTIDEAPTMSLSELGECS